MNELSKGQSAESNGNKRPINLPGIYRHEAAGKEIITVADMNDGSVQADALVRVGFHRVGDMPSKQEMKKMLDERHKAEEKLHAPNEAAKADDAPDNDARFNGTTTPSTDELVEAKIQAERERDEALATLEALKEGQKKTQAEKKS